MYKYKEFNELERVLFKICSFHAVLNSAVKEEGMSDFKTMDIYGYYRENVYEGEWDGIKTTPCRDLFLLAQEAMDSLIHKVHMCYPPEEVRETLDEIERRTDWAGMVAKYHPARRALAALTGDYPDLDKMEALFWEDRDGLPSWPEYVMLPMAAWYAIATYYLTKGAPLSLAQAGEVARLAAIGAWGKTQGIYRFDDALRHDLWNAPVKGSLPVETLCRLPEWSVYIETPGLSWDGRQIKGFWAHLEYDAQRGARKELRLLLDTSEGFAIVPLHMDMGDIHAAIEGWLAESRRSCDVGISLDGDIVRADAMLYSRLISLLLYICEDGADIRAADGTDAKPSRPTRLSIPDAPRIWEVGYTQEKAVV